MEKYCRKFDIHGLADMAAAFVPNAFAILSPVRVCPIVHSSLSQRLTQEDEDDRIATQEPV